MDSFLAIVQSLLVLVFVIFLAHTILRFMGRYTSKQNRLIKIIERVGVNNNSAISIVEICGKYYLMSFSQNENRILKELDDLEMEELISQIQADENNFNTSFVDGIKTFTGRNKKTDTYWNEGRK